MDLKCKSLPKIFMISTYKCYNKIYKTFSRADLDFLLGYLFYWSIKIKSVKSICQNRVNWMIREESIKNNI